jgi:hypothetical protein
MIVLDAFVVVELLANGTLAEETGSVLYTCDETLRSGHRARVKRFTR